MSESENVVEKIKGMMLPKWFWIVLAILLIAGMYLTAKWFYSQVKGGKKE